MQKCTSGGWPLFCMQIVIGYKTHTYAECEAKQRLNKEEDE